MKKTLAFFVAALFLCACLPLFPSAETPARSSAPAVIPAIREWTGASGGAFVLSDFSLVCETENTSVKHVSEAFLGMCKVHAPVNDMSKSKKIVFEISSDLPPEIGGEGYTLDITEKLITVRANTQTGLLYGGITLVQMAFSEGSIRAGRAVDYPSYPVRAGMIDVGRAWIPLDYVEQITKYMAWFKLNRIHLHINDDNGKANTGFRLESDVPGLSSVVNGEKRYYTKDEYRAYQKRMLEYGVTVVTEIDTPAHSAAFGLIPEDSRPPMLGDRSLDITDERRDETVAFVKALFDEYITGEDPVFVSKTVHIGTDEYDRAYSEEMRKYTKAVAEHVHSRGYTPCFWSGFGPEGFPGETELPGYLQCSMWDNSISGLESIVSGGYDMVNTLNARLYVVPTGNGFPDYFDLNELYSNWQVYKFDGWGIDKSVEPDYPHLLGACFALWNDLHYLNYGITKYDIFDRVRGMSCLIAEKTWLGDETKNISASDFTGRFESLSLYGGFSDPGGHSFASAAGFDGEGDPVEADFSRAKYDLENGCLVLDGGSYVSLGDKQAGFPLTVDLTLVLDEIPREPLFGGGDAAFYADCDGKGHVGFKVDHYTFLFDYSIPIGVETHLTLTCDGRSTYLAVDGEFDPLARTIKNAYCYAAKNQLNTAGSKLQNLVIPLAEIGKGFKGDIKSLRVYDFAVDTRPLVATRDLAYKAAVSVSGLEVQDGRLTAEMAVDGDEGTRLSFARDADEQWLVVDLGETHDVTKIEINFYEHVESYDVFVSTDGDNYKLVYSLRAGETLKKQTDTISLAEPTRARYVKYVQNKRNYVEQWNSYYSGGITEIHVYDFDRARYSGLVNRAFEKLASDGKNGENAAEIRRLANQLELLVSGDEIYSRNLEETYNALFALVEPASEPEPENSADSVPAPDRSLSENTIGSGTVILVAAAVLIVFAAAVFFVIRRKERQD